MNRSRAMAHSHWRTWLPTRHAQIEDPNCRPVEIPGTPARAWAVATLTVAAVGLAVSMVAGCGSSTSGAAPSDTGTAADTAAATPRGSASVRSADAATVAAIKDAYAKFFAPDTPEKISLELLQNGPAFKATLEKQGQGDYAQKSSAKVSTVALASTDVASVVYTIYVGGRSMLADQPGFAVRENGVWKVAEYTFCRLLTLENSAPAECHTPAGMNPPN